LELDVVEDLLWDNATIGKLVREMYGTPPAGTTDTRMFISPTVTDYLFFCPWRQAARAMAAALPSQVYFNLFDYAGSWNEWVFGEYMPYCVNEVCHAQDLAAIFFPFYAAPASAGVPPTPKADEIALSQLVQHQWGNFARTGSPSTSALPYPAFTPDGTAAMNMSIPAALVPDLRSQYCDEWDRIGYFRF
jgi:carboxylesterase type B